MRALETSPVFLERTRCSAFGIWNDHSTAKEGTVPPQCESENHSAHSSIPIIGAQRTFGRVKVWWVLPLSSPHPGEGSGSMIGLSLVTTWVRPKFAVRMDVG